MESLGKIYSEFAQLMPGEDSLRDFKIILAYILDKTPEELLLDPPFDIEYGKSLILKNYLRRRSLGEPVAKIIGAKEFWSLKFKVSKDTLDPRPESETLLEYIASKDLHPKKILDLGTGSGCLLLSLLHIFPNAQGIGTDISAAALAIALENSKNLGLAERARFINTNWSDGIDEKFDLIISNPPYVAKNDEINIGATFDPKVALYAEDNGLAAYKEIIPRIPNLIARYGLAILECAPNQVQEVQYLFQKIDFYYAIVNDTSLIPRAVAASQEPI